MNREFLEMLYADRNKAAKRLNTLSAQKDFIDDGYSDRVHSAVLEEASFKLIELNALIDRYWDTHNV